MSTRRSFEDAIRAVGVVIPANNEEKLLGAALDSLERSVSDVTARGVQAHVVIVLDSCEDASESVARAWELHVNQHQKFTAAVLSVDVGNVGRARAIGCDSVLNFFRSFDLAQLWLATTDADSRVPPHWLRTQLRQHHLGADAWAGRVAITDWPRHRRRVAAAWQRAYDAEEHPIHGANLGVSAKSYVEVGGFLPLRTSEDRTLCAALVESGANVYFDSSVSVVTSARRHARAPEGFASALSRFDVVANAVNRDDATESHIAQGQNRLAPT